MADAAGVSKSTVHRVWTAFNIQPHRQKHFKLSTDPFFAEKVRDIVGLYLNPPDNAMVLCVDEKSRTQALERTQPLLPLGLGYVEVSSDNQDENVATIKVRTRGRYATSARTMAVAGERGGRVSGDGGHASACSADSGVFHRPGAASVASRDGAVEGGIGVG